MGRKRESGADRVGIEIAEKDEPLRRDPPRGVEALAGAPAGRTAGDRRRLFVAVELSDAVRIALRRTAKRLEAFGVRGHFVAPQNYHLTVAFIGAVDASLTLAVSSRIRDALGGVEEFRVSLDTVGGYPNRRRPRVAWVGAAQHNARFAALCASVREALASFGIECAARDDPHVTLCRCYRESAAIPDVGFARRIVPIEAVTLFESHLDPRGVRYEPLAPLHLRRRSRG